MNTNLAIPAGKAYVIDVSQSVEHDHPHALEFLRKDLTNITEFFRKRNVNVLSMKELFDFVVDPRIKEGEEEAVLEDLNAKMAERKEEELSADQQVAEEVFKQIYIPRALEEVSYYYHSYSTVLYVF